MLWQVRMNGRNMFMGYLSMKDKTLEAFDDELWVRSGDIGKKDDDGFLYITGRIKGTLFLPRNLVFHQCFRFLDPHAGLNVLTVSLRALSANGVVAVHDLHIVVSPGELII